MEAQIKSFKNPKEFRKWLEKHFDKPQGIWLRMFKKNSGVSSITYDKALEEALCFGWIDSQMKKYDEKSYIQKFTQRRAKSVWSKRNTQIIEKLIKENRMHSSGLAQVEQAKNDERWESAYESFSTATPPNDFIELLNNNKKAKETYEKLSKAAKFSIYSRLYHAKKKETREKRLRLFVSELSLGRNPFA